MSDDYPVGSDVRKGTDAEQIECKAIAEAREDKSLWIKRVFKKAHADLEGLRRAIAVVEGRVERMRKISIDDVYPDPKHGELTCDALKDPS